MRGTFHHQGKKTNELHVFGAHTALTDTAAQNSKAIPSKIGVFFCFRHVLPLPAYLLRLSVAQLGGLLQELFLALAVVSPLRIDT